jgi:hypothetical protein
MILSFKDELDHAFAIECAAILAMVEVNGHTVIHFARCNQTVAAKISLEGLLSIINAAHENMARAQRERPGILVPGPVGQQ